ncbi:hypothetical protein HOF78_03350 [Candidatus Woesearchaeota archaeon]|jgi:hypothetical protein|nr:hypothetical protein [Candidatus Woesearchaeota archaeon]MBT6045103.1 hypothetical protein [Candidatus Woesearchaeota archaeon]
MKVKELLMSLAIAVMAALFIGLFFDAIYSAPEYEDFCGLDGPRAFKDRFEVPPETCENVYFVYEEEISQCNLAEGSPRFDYDEEGCQVYSDCNYCSSEFSAANEEYNRNLFFIISPIAIALILIGLFYSFEVAASGFMFGGVLLLIYSTGRYFSDMSKFMRVFVVFIELVLLLWIAKKKMDKK